MNGNKWNVDLDTTCSGNTLVEKNIIELINMENKYVYLREIFDLDENEKRKALWNNIEFIKNELRQEKKIEKEKEKQTKNKKKRKIKVPLNYCFDYNDITLNDNIENINFYETTFNRRRYIVDMYKTMNKKYFVKLVDITDGIYEDINFNEFKKKYMQPNLFDDFFNI